MTTKRRFKVDLGDEISFVLKVTDVEQAELLLGELSGTMMDGPFRGVLAILSARANIGAQRDKETQLLEKALTYISENHLGCKEAEAILDEAGYE